MDLLDLVAQPTETINEAVAKATENITPVTKPGEETKPDEKRKQIELAAEINANLYASLIEAPMHAYNNIVNYKLKTRKARKTLKGAEQEKRIEHIEKIYEENKTFINLEDDEFKRLRQVMLLKAEKDGGKVNEGADLAAAIMAMVLKRAVIFIPD